LKAVVLAAGKGTRLRPLTDNTPKPMLEVGGRPLLEWMLLRVREAGVEEALVVTNYLEDQIREYLGDGSRVGVELSYVTQPQPLGTAHGFQQAEGFAGGEPILGLYGDHFLGPGVLRRVVKAWRPGEALVCSMEVEDPSQYGALKLEGDRVVGVVEKPRPGEEPSNQANLGVYVFPPQLFDHLEETPKSSRGEYEVTDTIGLMASAGVPVRRLELSPGEWMDVGLPWSLLEANQRAMAGLETRLEGEVEPGAVLKGPVWVKPGARVRAGTYIEGPVVVGEDADVGPNCYIRASTCLGKGTRVGNACEVKNSIIGEGSHAAHLSYIGDSIIGKGCNLGAGTITANLRFDKTPVEVTVKGVRMSSGRRKLGVIMGDHVQTGVNVSIHPGVVVGSGAWIAPGLTVQRDVEGGALLYAFSRPEKKTRDP